MGITRLGCFILLFSALLHYSNRVLSAQTLFDAELTELFVSEVNTMRSNPAQYLPQLEAYARQVRSFTPNKKQLDKAMSEIRVLMKKQKPLGMLHVDSALMKAAYDHMADAQNSGLVGHIGSDGSDPGSRAQRYTSFTALSEAITYGHVSTSLMLSAFLVDEGTPSRGHRLTMLSDEYTRIGVAVGSHPTYSIQVVVLVAR